MAFTTSDNFELCVGIYTIDVNPSQLGVYVREYEWG